MRALLRDVMATADLESVTSKEVGASGWGLLAGAGRGHPSPHGGAQVREELERRTGHSLAQHKDFIDNEMLLVLAQMDRPSRVFPHLYLVGSGVGSVGGRGGQGRPHPSPLPPRRAPSGTRPTWRSCSRTGERGVARGHRGWRGGVGVGSSWDTWQGGCGSGVGTGHCGAPHRARAEPQPCVPAVPPARGTAGSPTS